MPEDLEVRLNPSLYTSQLYMLKPAKFAAQYMCSYKSPVLEKFSY